MTGNKGKFSERLKRINLFRRNKNNKNIDNDIQIEDNNKIYTNFLKVVAAIPGLVYDNVVNGSNIANKVKNADDVNVIVNVSTISNNKDSIDNLNKK